MGTISARDAVRVLDLTEQVAAACLAAVSQALEIRRRRGDLPASGMADEVSAMHKVVLGLCAYVEEDRPLEQELRSVCTAIRQRRWKLYG